MLEKNGDARTFETFSASPGRAADGSFRLSLLGPFSLTGPDGSPLDISGKKNRLLLSMLANADGCRMTRDALAGGLWPEKTTEQARSSLRQGLAVLRKELNGADGAVISSMESTVSLNLDYIVIDTIQFQNHIDEGSLASLQRAVELWRGPFLADITGPEAGLDQWLTEQREHYTDLYVAALDKLARVLDGYARVEVAKKLVQADALREASHRLLIEAFCHAGERAQALRHYDKLRKLFHDELGVEPSAELQQIRLRIASAAQTDPVSQESTNSDDDAASRHSSSAEPLPHTSPMAAMPAPAAAFAGRAVLRRAGWRFTASAAPAILVAVSLVGAAGWSLTRPAPAPAANPAVAILPFESLSGSADDQRFAEGLTVDTISDLSRYREIRVIAKDTTDAYRGKAVDVRALGKDLRVSHILKGTFQREGNHIRFTAQLIDASTGETLWSDRYDRLSGDIFVLQSDVANHVANSLAGREGKVSQSVLVDAKRKLPADLGAYELYLLAQEKMHSDLSDAHMKEGQKILDQAIAKDPTLARAYVKYAHAYAWRFTYEGGAAELMQQMLAYARKAVSLDPMDAEAHASLGYALTLSGDPKQGEAEFDEALRLSPNSFDILMSYACMAHAYGRADRGAEAADRAISVNPDFPNFAIPCLRLGLVMVGRYADVIRLQSRQPESEMNTDGYVVLAGSLASVGKKEEAAALAKRGVERFPGLLTIERFALNRGWPPGASKVMETLMRRAGFPACAASSDLAGLKTAVHLPECAG